MFSNTFVLSFCLFVLLVDIGEEVSLYCSEGCSNPSNSQFKEICCNQDNLGSAFTIPVNALKDKLIFCPSTLPEICQEEQLYSNCTEILKSDSSASSGYYNIQGDDGSVHSVYCDMNGTNCDGEGGWSRIAYLNMTEPGATCPPGLTERQFENIDYSLCGRNVVGCQSTFYSTIYSQSLYSKVCGRVRGYQFGRGHSAFIDSASIQSFYVEGISITHSNLPKKHIWTYAAGNRDDQASIDDCPCNNGSTRSVVSFVGADYYCESGPDHFEVSDEPGLLATDPLWDGKQCDELETPCCTTPKMPWFTKSLPGYYSDQIEVRVCTNGGPASGDVPIDLIELYIK